MKHTTTQEENTEIKHTRAHFETIFKYPNPIPYECVGVYAIKNTKNGKMYIGSSKNLRARTLQHISALKNFHGCNTKIREDIKRKSDLKYIEFHLLQYYYDGNITDYYLAQKEKWFIELLETVEHGYNFPIPTTTGRRENDRKIYTKTSNQNAWRYPTEQEPTPDTKVKQDKEHDRIMVSLPKGAKDWIKENTGKSCNAFFNELFKRYREERAEPITEDPQTISTEDSATLPEDPPGDIFADY